MCNILKKFNASDEQKEEIKGLVGELYAKIIALYDGLEYADNKSPYAKQRMGDELTKFMKDNFIGEGIESLCELVEQEFQEMAGCHYTLHTHYGKDGVACTEWHIANDMNDCLKQAQYNAREEYRYNKPTFVIFDNWSGAVYDNDWVQEHIRTLIVRVVIDGTCHYEEITDNMGDALRQFNERANFYEKDLKKDTFRIVDVRPYDWFVKQEEIETIDGKKITISIKQFFGCDIKDFVDEIAPYNKN